MQVRTEKSQYSRLKKSRWTLLLRDSSNPSDKSFSYLDTGKSERVTFRAKKYLLTELFDWFDSKTQFSDRTDDEVTASVTVNIQAMQKWMLQYAMHTRILLLQGLAEAVTEDIRKAVENYKMREEKNMSIWRLQTRTSMGSISAYCRENNIAAVGWSLLEISEKERASIKTYDEYLEYAENVYDSFNAAKRFHDDIRENDLIWMRDNGIYYIGRVSQETIWVFNTSADASVYDASNQLTNIKWYKFNESDESSVPGAISTSFIKGSTFQRINKRGVENFSQLLYNELTGTSYYNNMQLSLCEENFYSLLSPEDCEDLLYIWLYNKYKYICIPSTNKKATQLYEFVLLNPENGEHIYIQVKNGSIDLDGQVYKDLNGEVWFFTTSGTVSNLLKNMHVADPTELYNFAISEASANIIPPSIKAWVGFLCNQENNRIKSQTKGIIFDTNKSYSSSAQDEMMKSRKVSAYGRARKYINSFNEYDYVLYYEKGKGIFAIGKIISPAYNDEEKDETYRKVEEVIFPKDKSEITYITPQKVKAVLKKSFYFASTIKLPFISESDVSELIKVLKEKQNG